MQNAKALLHKAAVIASFLKVDPLIAQTPLQIQEQPKIPLRLPAKKEPILNSPSPSIQPENLLQVQPEFSQRRIFIRRFIFNGNTVISTRALEKIAAPFIGRYITRSELLKVQAAITKFYIDKGYITSGAILATQENKSINPTDAVLTIQIVEGGVERINISGSTRLHSYIRGRLVKATKPLNKNRLEEALRQLHLDPMIEDISAELKEESKAIVLNVYVREHKQLKVSFNLDNYGSPATGTFNRGVLLSASLLNIGDQLDLSYINSDGRNTGEVIYTLPINAQNGTIRLSYQNDQSHVIEQPFNSLDILSSARFYEMSFRQPVLRHATQKASSELALGVVASREESESSLLSIPYALSLGADSKGRTRISALRFFQEWVSSGVGKAFVARSQFSVGTGAFDTTSEFFAWRGQVLSLIPLLKSSLILRGDLQISDRPLAALEQFGLGGAATVRGYRQDALLTDNGFLFSAELRIPTWKNRRNEFDIIPFFDVGTTWNNSAKKQDNNFSVQSGSLASLGLGLQLVLDEHLNARLDWGIPLISFGNSRGNTWQEQGIYLKLDYQP